MDKENELLGVERWVIEALLHNKPESEAAKLKAQEALAFPAAPTVEPAKPLGYVVLTPEGEFDTVPVMDDIHMAMDIAHDLNCELHPTHTGQPYTVKPVFDAPNQHNTAEVLRLVELLGNVAHQAHVAMDDGEDTWVEGARVSVLTHESAVDLSKALDACDAEPVIPDQYVRPGWLTVLEKLRTSLKNEGGKQSVIQLIAVPEGWKLVPLKPTEQMCLDAFDADLSTGMAVQGEDARQIYLTMIASSPKAEAIIELADDLILIPSHPTPEMVQAALDSGAYHDKNARAVLIDEFRTMANAGKVASLQSQPQS